MSVLARARVVLEGDAIHLKTQLDAAEKAVHHAGERMARAGMELTHKVTLPLAGLATAAVHSATKFDETMRKTAALTSLTAEQVEKLKGPVHDVALEFGVAGEAAADALFFIASPTLTVAQTMETLRQSLKAAAVGLGDAKTVALGAVGAMNAYAKTGLTATQATDILTMGVKTARIEASELVPVLGRVTSIGAALNIPFETLVGTMSVLTLTGSSAAEAGTQLSAVMSTLMGTSDEGAALLNEYGLSLVKLREIAQGPGGLIEVFRVLEKSTRGAGAEQIAKLETIIPNIRALRGVMTGLAQKGELVDDILGKVANSTGALDAAFSVFEKGPAHQMRLAMARIHSALLEIGNVVLPIVLPGIAKLTEAVKHAAEWFAHLHPDVRTLAVHMLGLAAAIGPVMLMLGGVLKIFALIVWPIKSVLMLGAAFHGLGAAIAGSAVLASIPNAFGAAAIAGTGLRGVVWGLVPAFRALTLAALPWLVGAAIVAGLYLVGKRWLQIKENAEKAAEKIRKAREETEAAVRAIAPEKAAAQVKAFDETIAGLTKQMNQLRQRQQDASRLTTFAADATRTQASEAARATITEKESAEALMRKSLVLQETIMHMRQQRDIVAAIAAVYEEANAGVKKTTNVLEKQQKWAQAAAEAMTELQDSLRQATQGELALGSQFDLVSAQAEAYKTAILALVEAGVPLDASLGKQGTSVRALAGAYLQLQKSIALVDVVAADAAKKAAESQDRQVKKAKESLKGVVDMSKELRQAVADMTGRMLDDVVDFAFGAKKSFGEFIRSAIADLAKLILKIQLMRLLFPEGGGGLAGSLFGSFARGGFLPGGELGLVGESGPELVAAGRRGVTVTPMPATSVVRGGGEVMHMHNHFHVSAIDQRGVAQFFEENEGHMAAAMLRSYQKSMAMRNHLFGKR